MTTSNLHDTKDTTIKHKKTTKDKYIMYQAIHMYNIYEFYLSTKNVDYDIHVFITYMARVRTRFKRTLKTIEVKMFK